MATVWIDPRVVGSADAQADSAHPQLPLWLSRLGLAGREVLDARVQTQALLDDPVAVMGVRRGWAEVRVLQQTGGFYRHGIVGWVRTDQLTFSRPPAASTVATVAVRLAQVGSLTVSYGTALPVLRATPGRLLVATPAGPAWIGTGLVRLRPLAPSGASLVREARRFLGLPYLWAGISGYGFDCSGLTYMVYRQFGIRLARDAADQARGGTAVAVRALRPGDLVFFAYGAPGQIDHVGIYAGGGRMIDSPHTGGVVEVVPLHTGPGSGYAGARRYVASSPR